MDKKQYLNITDVASLVNRSAQTIFRWIREGKFPPGNSVATNSRFWTTIEVAKWLNDNAKKGAK